MTNKLQLVLINMLIRSILVVTRESLGRASDQNYSHIAERATLYSRMLVPLNDGLRDVKSSL